MRTRRDSAIGRYVVTAAAARSADEGFAPAVALLVAASGRHPAFAGLLLAAAGIPHVVAGPLVGAALDAARNRRAVLAAGPIVLGLVLAGVAVGLGAVPDALCVALVVAAGCAGPLVMGGLSAELTQLAPMRPERALALDGASYNVAAMAGPGAVAAGAALAGAQTAVLCLAVLALGGAALVLRLPAHARADGERRALRDGLAGARRLWDARPLRIVTAGTTLAFVGAGALPLLVIARAQELGSATAGAALLAVTAAAALGGSLLSTAARRSPEARVVRALLVIAVALAACGLAPGLLLAGVALAVVGLADGTLLPAILAVRIEHSRPHERGAVFTTAASAKVVAGACGAAFGGLLIAAAGAGPALLAAAALHVLGAFLCLGARGGA